MSVPAISMYKPATFGWGMGIEKSINVETAYRYIRRFEGHLVSYHGGLIIRLLNKSGFRKARIQATLDEIAELHKRLDVLEAEWTDNP
ncbi:MAG: hypothetical protein OXM61_17325 [Candidatus Poribacteria bacterium]|nr:hypothetical protein [Candidatus Poribacteria bacterium]